MGDVFSVQVWRRAATPRTNGDDGTHEVAGRSGGAPVIFGEWGDAWLLGALSLQSLGLPLDPFERALGPMRLVLDAAAPG